MAAAAAARDHAAVLPVLTRERRRLEGGVGTRELCSQLCEALADDLQASDCLVSRVDAERDLLVDLAGFTRTPQRWLAPAVEYPIGRLSGHAHGARGRAAPTRPGSATPAATPPSAS